MHKALLALVILTPAAAAAQFRIPGRRALPPAIELPPQAPAIARDMVYQRMRYAVSTYSVVTRVVSPAYTGGYRPAWTSGGVGSHLNYQLVPNLALTADVTTSFIGGPAAIETGELGLRVGADSLQRVRPFADARLGYAYAMNDYGSMLYVPNSSGTPYDARYSKGLGAFGGGGVEFGVTRTISLMTSAQAGRFRMWGFDYRGGAPSDRGYMLTMYRFLLGVQWNPVQLVRVLHQDEHQ